MSKEPTDWSGSMTFEEYVILLFERKDTQSKEFQALLRLYGREKLVKIWEKYKSETHK